jgi:hypothetical protein
MARYNEILVGRFNRFVQKHFSMKGPANLVSISDEMQPIWPFFNGPENRYLESWDRFAVDIFTTAAATFQTGVRFRNPVGSNAIIVVENITIWPQGAANDPVIIAGGSATTDLGTLITVTQGNTMDLRTIRSAATAIISTQNNSATIPLLTNNASMYRAVSSGAAGGGANNKSIINTDNQEITVLPGAALQFVNNAVNVGVQMDIQWRERFLEDSERT